MKEPACPTWTQLASSQLHYLVKRTQVLASWPIVRIKGDNPGWKCVPVVRGHSSHLTASPMEACSLLWRIWLPLVYAHISLCPGFIISPQEGLSWKLTLSYLYLFVSPKVSCRPDWPQTHHVGEDDLELPNSGLHLPSAKMSGVWHHTCFVQCWGWSPGLHACWASTLFYPSELATSPIWLLVLMGQTLSYDLFWRGGVLV